MRLRYVTVLVGLAALPIVIAKVVPASEVSLAVGALFVIVIGAFSQARWLNGDRGWPLKLLLTREAWLHPWATRRRHLAKSTLKGRS